MALTATDMVNLREMVEDVISRRVDPRFERLETRMDGLEGRMGGLEVHMGRMQLEMAGLNEQGLVLKELVKDHEFEIMRLKHREV